LFASRSAPGDDRWRNAPAAGAAAQLSLVIFEFYDASMPAIEDFCHDCLEESRVLNRVFQ